MKTEFKVNDKVLYTDELGKRFTGYVSQVNLYEPTYPVIVRLDNGGRKTFTAGGSLLLGSPIRLTKIENEMTQPTKEQILEAAGTSTQAKEALKKLYPTLFPEDKSVIVTNNSWNKIICESLCGEYAGKSFYLDNGFNWEVKRDSRGDLRLVPTEK